MKSLGKIDDFNRVEWTALNTHAASDTKLFRDKAYGRGGFDLNAELACLVEGTGLCAFLFTFFGFALIRVDNGYPELVGRFHHFDRAGSRFLV